MENGAVIPPCRVMGSGGGVPASQLKSERDIICRVGHMFSSAGSLMAWLLTRVRDGRLPWCGLPGA